MDLVNLSLKYFAAFSSRNLDALAPLFAENVVLRDWDISAQGKRDVLEANSKIFSSVETIEVRPLALYPTATSVACEIEITVNGQEKLLVTDVIDYNREGLIQAVRAYKG